MFNAKKRNICLVENVDKKKHHFGLLDFTTFKGQ